MNNMNPCRSKQMSNWESLLLQARQLFQEQGHLIELSGDRAIVFVGDTHGDVQATQIVLSRFLSSPNTVIVFLGDYVDRGPKSEQNLQLLLRTKLDYPETVFLLMGNHEGWTFSPFSPADFWESLQQHRQQSYAKTLAYLPLAVHIDRGILALHGALPDVERIDEIEQITPNTANWQKITWGDWIDEPGYELLTSVSLRPTFGEDYFQTVMDRLELSVLIRSHQLNVPTFMFNDHCLTIFTTSAYGNRNLTVAMLSPGSDRIHNAHNLKLLEL